MSGLAGLFRGTIRVAIGVLFVSRGTRVPRVGDCVRVEGVMSILEGEAVEDNSEG